ncbi:MAG: hypothetical protein AB8B57_10675 [Congregibacter sp.]
MSTYVLCRNIALTAAATALTASVAFGGESSDDSKKRRGPPPEAFEVCADQSEGQACSFTGRRGDIAGTCMAPPRDEEVSVLACAPERGSRKRRVEIEEEVE